jgi:hypothetical protein
MAQPAPKIPSEAPQTANEAKSNKDKLAAEFPSKEITLLLFNGMRLAGKAWGPKSSAVSSHYNFKLTGFIFFN